MEKKENFMKTKKFGFILARTGSVLCAASLFVWVIVNKANHSEQKNLPLTKAAVSSKEKGGAIIDHKDAHFMLSTKSGPPTALMPSTKKVSSKSFVSTSKSLSPKEFAEADILKDILKFLVDPATNHIYNTASQAQPKTALK